MSSKVDQPEFAARLMVSEANPEVDMLIRIRRHGKALNGTQIAEDIWIISRLLPDPTAIHTHSNTKFRILCGSI